MVRSRLFIVEDNIFVYHGFIIRFTTLKIFKVEGKLRYTLKYSQFEDIQATCSLRESDPCREGLIT